MDVAFLDEWPDGICMSDAQGDILYSNRVAEAILDVSHGAARGERLCELLCGHLAVGGARECASACELLKPGFSGKEVILRGSYGPKYIATWTDFNVKRRSVWKNLRVRCFKPFPPLAGEGKHLTIIEDCSAEVEIEKEKEEWRQKIAHDLRSPLTNIYATINLFKGNAGRSLPEGSFELIEAAERSCRKILEMITLYLHVSQLDAGVVEIRRAPIRLTDLVRTEIAAQKATARVKRLEIFLAAPEEIVVEADSELLSRVVQNVLDNAVKFTPPGGRVVLSARVDGDQAELSIKDTGRGISPERLPFLFERSRRARAPRPDDNQGAGLGLFFCREALRKMRGGIAASSKLGEGAEFVICLPLAAG